ncbi:alpha/beta fold hydrolase [Streptomyces cellulosae]
MDWDEEDRTSECAMLKVPLDYTKPAGRQIEIAVSRVRAAEPEKRRGVLLVNPGGPGLQSTSFPHQLSQEGLNPVGREYDLIGFDIRGVVHSDKIGCPELDPASIPRLPPEITGKERAKRLDEEVGTRLRTCALRDPDFARAMTTQNIARDMDRIRQVLGEKKISYMGFSWGTGLGAVYRSMYDRHVDRMLLESVLYPGQPQDRPDDRLAAIEARFHDFAAWIARNDRTYRFGTSGPGVARALIALRDELAKHPRQVGSGDTTQRLDGDWANTMLGSLGADWAKAARALAAARDGRDPELADARLAPAPVGQGFEDPYQDGEMGFVLSAIPCNDSRGARNFEEEWAHRESLKGRYPVATYDNGVNTECSHWPFPAHPPAELSKGISTLQLVGHAYETNTVIAWAKEMQHRIGGSLLTVEDDAHSGLRHVPCKEKAITFFLDGRTHNGTCEGVPVATPDSQHPESP